MKINDVLECINKTLREERKIKGLPEVLGHFVFYIYWEKRMGAIKAFDARVQFFNIHKGASYPVVSHTYIENCPTDKIEETKEKVTLMVLEMLFKALRLGKGKGAYENFVNGTFEGWT